MFDIEYKGGNTIVLSGKKTTIITDPKLSLIGLKDAKTTGCVELATEDRFAVKADGAKLVVNGPGEYEIGDFVIKGIAAVRHLDSGSNEKLDTIYRVECGNVAIGVIGNVEPKLNDDQLENLGVIDILIVPVGGSGYTLDATSAVALVRAISPKVVVPIHYADSGISYEVPQDSAEVFVKEMGAPVENVSKLKVKNDSSLPMVLTTYILSRTR